ncbi:hypothetical protein [Glutamicibacter sp. HZAU]|uniref:hypothetical protein n=1 Tax=Glutamicibacter sp. HZAU TaxID=2049891 RepID=UPI000FFC0895|nr:hypothetical protein [Glutamicibacter sp. HZAU]RWZ83210.1 hypothetical protein EKH49_08440 [Glutamicibacter sp. HZAU]
MEEMTALVGQISTFDLDLWVKDQDFEKKRNDLNSTETAQINDCVYLEWDAVCSTKESPFVELETEFEQQFRVVPDGKIAKRLNLDALLIRRKSNRLLVVFHGALDREKYTLPRFEFKNTVKRFDGSVLFISDPSLQTHDELGLAWYVGDEVDDGHEMITTLVREFARHLSADKIVLTGSSGGGFAALATSFHIDGSVALPFSPQTSAEGYRQGHRTRLLSSAFSTWDDLKQKLVSNATRFDLGALYNSNEARNKVWFIQNTGDKFHTLNHCIPFAKSLGLDFSKGNYHNENVKFDLVFYRDGHKPPLPEMMNEYIARAFDL